MLHENHEYDIYTLDKINNEATTNCIRVEYYIPVLLYTVIISTSNEQWTEQAGDGYINNKQVY